MNPRLQQPGEGAEAAQHRADVGTPCLGSSGRKEEEGARLMACGSAGKGPGKCTAGCWAFGASALLTSRLKEIGGVTAVLSQPSRWLRQEGHRFKPRLRMLAAGVAVQWEGPGFNPGTSNKEAAGRVHACGGFGGHSSTVYYLI